MTGTWRRSRPSPLRRTILRAAAVLIAVMAAGAPCRRVRTRRERTPSRCTGNPKYPAVFPHFDYADPSAPKGGRVVLGQTGSFDTLNPLIIRGEPVAGIREWVYERR